MKDRIKVYGTKEGKLYIKAEELFALPKVQELIRKIATKGLPSTKEETSYYRDDYSPF